ncbi:MAG: transcriptional repressor [Bacillales bacterium]|jgi:Fur family zinc uptake transcriptional regulator|nr:transcriptional repressor [Bacillales bacterium]
MNIEQAINKLKINGYKITKQREHLLELFFNQDQYVPAKDIILAFQKEFPGASFDTIYRNIYTFVELEILESIDMNNEKQFRVHCNTKLHHHHFICKKCGVIKPINICPIETVEHQLPGYQINNHKFELFGYCPPCNK